ncbi:diaminopimelate epimerase [bacterium]|nr:MAG: diaminopimelate epimerase [bacterium]
MTVRIPFWKLQSIGNDFPLVHIADLEDILARGAAERGEVGRAPAAECFVAPDAGVTDVDGLLMRLAVAMADRRYGIGGDGILAAKPLSEGRVLLRMFNPDGTEDFCGNGLRCAAVHAHAQGWVGETFTIEHLGRDVPVTIGGGEVATRLGGATYDPAEVPLRGAELFRGTLPNGRTGSALSTGTTHTIVWSDELPDDVTFLKESPPLEVHEMFPERTSIMWTQALDRDHLRLRIWERGVGETRGCGTGSTAAAVDYLRGEERSGRVRVDNPGGTVYVTWDPAKNETVIEGTAELVYSGEFLYRM